MKRTTPKRYVAFSFLLNRKATSSLSIFRVYSIKYRFHELAFLACLLLIATHIHELNKYISLQIYLNLLTLQNALFPLFSADSLFFPPVQNLLLFFLITLFYHFSKKATIGIYPKVAFLLFT